MLFTVHTIPHLISSLFFENEAITQKLQLSPQNQLSFVYNFCQGLTFAGELLPLASALSNYTQLFSHRGRISARPESRPYTLAVRC